MRWREPPGSKHQQIQQVEQQREAKHRTLAKKPAGYEWIVDDRIYVDAK